MNELAKFEPTPLIEAATTLYDAFDMDGLPEDLKRDSRRYYYLSIYPGLRHMQELTAEDLPKPPDVINNVYVHTPFCSGVCEFCSYNLIKVSSDEPVTAYLDTVKQEIMQRGAETELDVSYIYFGGGTPSLIPPKTLESFFDFLNSNQLLSDGHYGTIELHPEFFGDQARAQAFIDVLKANGINRVSVGFETADEQVLQDSNRRHGADFLTDAIGFLKANDMLVNLDLMYGLPDLSLEKWERTLAAAVASEPDSVTPYYLFVNYGTGLGNSVARGKVELPTHRTGQIQHIMAQQCLAAAGFHELPNDFFGKKYDGFDASSFTQDALPSESVSLPLGAGAYGYYDEMQFVNHFAITSYRQNVENGVSPVWRGHRFEGLENLHRDVMFSFKNSPYLDRGRCIARYGVDPVDHFSAQFERLSSLGLLSVDDDKARVTLTAKGQLCVEEIGWQFALPSLHDHVNDPISAAERYKLRKHHFAALYDIADA